MRITISKRKMKRATIINPNSSFTYGNADIGFEFMYTNFRREPLYLKVKK